MAQPAPSPYTNSNIRPVPEITFKMSRQNVKIAQTLWNFGLTLTEIILSLFTFVWTLCPSKLIFGQTTAKNGRKLSDVRL